MSGGGSSNSHAPAGKNASQINSVLKNRLTPPTSQSSTELEAETKALESDLKASQLEFEQSSKLIEASMKELQKSTQELLEVKDEIGKVCIRSFSSLMLGCPVLEMISRWSWISNP